MRRSVLCLALLAGCVGPVSLHAAQQESVADTSPNGAGVGRIAATPVRLLQGVVAWIGERVDASRLVPRVASARAWFQRVGLRPGLAGHGRQSGTGPWLDAGRLESPSSSSWLQFGGGITYLGYWKAEGRAGVRVGGAGALDIELVAQVIRRPRDEFYGLGNATPEGDRADYGLSSRSLGISLSRAVRDDLRVHLEADWSRTETGAGANDAVPDVMQVFPSAAVPGYGLTARMVTLGGGLAWRRGLPLTQSRRGAWADAGYRIALSRSAWFEDFGQLRGAFGVERPIAGARGSLLVAADYAVTRGGGASVPFYDLPSLGGRALSAYPWDRFRGRTLLLTRTELHARMWRQSADAVWVDGIVFAAHGLVSDNLSNDLRRLPDNHSYGVALGVVTRAAPVGRVGIAFGRQGPRVVLAFGSTY